MTRILCCVVVATAMMAACESREPGGCRVAHDPAAGHAFDEAAFDFARQDASDARHGSVETDATRVVITYQADDGRAFRAVYEKRGHSLEFR